MADVDMLKAMLHHAVAAISDPLTLAIKVSAVGGREMQIWPSLYRRHVIGSGIQGGDNACMALFFLSCSTSVGLEYVNPLYTCLLSTCLCTCICTCIDSHIYGRRC